MKSYTIEVEVEDDIEDVADMMLLLEDNLEGTGVNILAVQGPS